MKLADIHIETDGGPWATHNMPCAVCGKKHAVLDLETGFFHPCWECRSKYDLVDLAKIKRPWWFFWRAK